MVKEIDILQKVKMTLRVKNKAFDEDINDLIEEAKADLKTSGVVNIDTDDKLIQKAIKTYCKANFGLENKDSEKYEKSYESIKIKLSLCEEYKKHE